MRTAVALRSVAIRSLLFSLVLLALSQVSFGQIAIGVSVGFAPPTMPTTAVTSGFPARGLSHPKLASYGLQGIGAGAAALSFGMADTGERRSASTAALITASGTAASASSAAGGMAGTLLITPTSAT